MQFEVLLEDKSIGKSTVNMLNSMAMAIFKVEQPALLFPARYGK